MPIERTARRYTAYFRGWCQAFGEHDVVVPQDEGVSWLFGEDQIGFILPPGLTRALNREVLGKRRMTPLLDIGRGRVRVGRFRQALPEAWRRSDNSCKLKTICTFTSPTTSCTRPAHGSSRSRGGNHCPSSTRKSGPWKSA